MIDNSTDFEHKVVRMIAVSSVTLTLLAYVVKSKIVARVSDRYQFNSFLEHKAYCASVVGVVGYKAARNVPHRSRAGPVKYKHA